MKKGADLFARREALPPQEAVEEMVDHANKLLTERSYTPYYLYRQKYMSGSLENVGWCRDGDLGLYNVYMMEELSSILALGGGAVSKRNLPEHRLERQCNPKYPKQYVERFTSGTTFARRGISPTRRTKRTRMTFSCAASICPKNGTRTEEKFGICLSRSFPAAERPIRSFI